MGSQLNLTLSACQIFSRSLVILESKNVIDVITQLFTFDSDIGKILDEILLEVKAKLMPFEGVGLIFTGGCATF